jgi:hypothetical protein
MRAAIPTLVVLLLGCAVEPPPHGNAGGALALAWDRSHGDDVNCARKDCERWFRVAPQEKGDLLVDVRAATASGNPPRYTVQLVDDDGTELALEASSGQPAAVEFGRPVAPRSYLLKLGAEPGVRAFDFSITVGFEAAPPPPPPPEPEPEPEFETHTTHVLEAEGYGQDTAAVLIESGARHGMQVGFPGRLVEGDREIGRVVIEQVYPDGSRARVQGTLLAPVTHATLAEIEVPRGLSRQIESLEDLLGDPNAPDDPDGIEERGEQR